MAENGTCSCGCAALKTVSDEAACQCSCSCCGTTGSSREEEIAELRRLLESVQQRLIALDAR
jgi:uncharacterized protein YfcZ (UPF0381/DUF406 family)